MVHRFSLHATSRETRTLVTRARLKSFWPPLCNVRAYITCSTIRPVLLSSCPVRACTRWLRILQQNLLHPALTKTFMGTSILFLKYRYLPIQNLLDTSTSPFKKTKKTREWSVSLQKKKDELKRKEEAKHPTSLASISPQKRRYGDAVEYKMNKYSRIEQAKNLVFQWKASNTDQSEITQILQSAPNGQSVGLKAKVLFKGDKETVYSKTREKKPHQIWHCCRWHYWSGNCNSVGKSNRRSWTAQLLSLQRT